MTGQAGSVSKARVNNAKQFSGENSTSTAIQYCYHFNQCKRCNFFPRCRFKHICRRCRGKHQASNCLTTSQLYKLGKTPIKLDTIFYHTQNYSDYHFLTQGFMQGFKLQYISPRLPRFSKNLPSLGKQYSVAEQKIDREISLGRVTGPFKQPPFPTLQVSPLGLVPKKDGDYRLTHHLHVSYPEATSIISFIFCDLFNYR